MQNSTAKIHTKTLTQSFNSTVIQFVSVALNCRHLLKQQSLRIFRCSAFITGARRHGKGGGAFAPRKCCKVFCALVVTVKRSEDQLFMHYFHNFSSASGGFTPRPAPGLHSWTPGIHPWTPLADFCLQTP